MFVRTTSTRNSPRKSVKVVESVREGFKVKQRMLLHVGIGKNDEEIEKLKCLGNEFIMQEQLRREAASPQQSLFEPDSHEERLAKINRFNALKGSKRLGRKAKVTLKDVASSDLLSLADLVEEKRVVEGIHDIAGHVYRELGYDQLLERVKDKELLKDLTLMRLACPSSKMKSQNILSGRYAKTHDLDAIYRLMDKIFTKIDDIRTITFNKTKALIPGTIDLLLFDCTTLYFESTETDDLRKFGYSKDHRFNTTQVVLALATNSDGLPIGYELFEGNKAEVKTLISCIESWKKSFNIGQVCFVADRAMMSDDNLVELESKNYTYVIAAKLRCLPVALQNEIMLEKNYKIESFGSEIGRVGEFEYNKRRVIVSYKTNRASRDAHQRDKIVSKIQKRLGVEGDTQKLITNQGVKKYTQSGESRTVLAQAKIDNDAMWDGLHGVITNIKPKKNKAEKAELAVIDTKDEGEDAVAVISRYSRLWKIEESFRINKHTLSMRPIFHFKPERIKAHIAICYMAFSVLRNMEYKVKLTQKISPERMIDELVNVQASLYRHTPTNRLYRMPGAFSNDAAKIYKTFHIKRKNNAQEIILEQK
jgi:transposase